MNTPPSLDNVDALLRSYRKKPVVPPDERPHNLTAQAASLPARLLPHRGSMLLVDRVEGVDLERRTVWGTRTIGPGHLGLDGHFPGYPVLPGTIQIEMLGQLALCLYRFVEHGTLELPAELPPPDLRATKILGAHFLAEVRPGDEVTMVARLLELDDFLGTSLCQAIVGERVCCVMVGEVCFL